MTTAAYPASWQNRFFDRIRDLPLPRRLVFVLITAAFIALNTAVAWFERALPVGSFDPYQLNFQIWLLVVMVAGDHFVDAAGRALDAFRPALTVDDDEFERLRRTYTTVPERDGWVIGLLALGFSLWALSFGLPYQRSGLSAAVFYLTSVYMFWLVFFFMYFLWRIVRNSVELYARIRSVNLFHLEPLHAFSGLSAQVGIFLVLAGVLSYLTNFVFTDAPNPSGFAFFAAINGAVAIAVFIYPLQGIHRRLELAKGEVSEANDRRLEAAYRELHRRADAREIDGMSELHHEIQALLDFRREIEATSTWPWGAGTLRAFVTALLLPIVVWATQQVLVRLFGG